MLYVQITARLNGIPAAAQVVEFDYATMDPRNFETRNDWKSFEAAAAVAKALGPQYIATDAGPYVSPRYDVIKLPQVGDDVSYAFNGDYYPCGKVVKISTSLKRIETSDGSVFFRRKLSGSWLMNQTWSLVSGTINKRNPEF